MTEIFRRHTSMNRENSKSGNCAVALMGAVALLLLIALVSSKCEAIKDNPRAKSDQRIIFDAIEPTLKEIKGIIVKVYFERLAPTTYFHMQIDGNLTVWDMRQLAKKLEVLGTTALVAAAPEGEDLDGSFVVCIYQSRESVANHEPDATSWDTVPDGPSWDWLVQ